MALATRCPNCGTTFRVVSDQLKLRRGLVKCGHCATVFNGIEQLRYVATLGDSPNTVIRPVPPTPPAPPAPPAPPMPVAPRADAPTAIVDVPAPVASPAGAAPAVPRPADVPASPPPAAGPAAAAEPAAGTVEPSTAGPAPATTALASPPPASQPPSRESEPPADEAQATSIPPATEASESESESESESGSEPLSGAESGPTAPAPEPTPPAVAAEYADVPSPEPPESVARETGAAESASPSPAPTTDTPSQPVATPAPVTRPAPAEPDRIDPGFDPALSVENHPAARPLPEPSFDREWVAKAATAYAAARAMPVNEAEPKELPPLTLIEVERRPGMPVPRSIAEDPDRVPSFMQQRAEMSRALRLALRVVAPVLALTFAGQALWLFHDEVAAALPATRPALEAACARAGCVIELPKRAQQLRVASAELRQTSEDGGHELRVGLRNESHWNQAWPVLDVSLSDVQGKVIARRMLAASDYLPAQADAERLARDGLAANAEQQLVVPLRIDATGVAGYTVDAFFP